MGQDIEQGLKLIRMRQRRMAYILAGLMPLALLAVVLAEVSADLEVPVIVAMLLYGALLFAYSLRLALTDCPRCERFYHFGWWANPFTQRCLNCGLRLDGS